MREARAGGIKAGPNLNIQILRRNHGPVGGGRRKRKRGKAIRMGRLGKIEGRNEKRREWPRITDSRTHKF